MSHAAGAKEDVDIVSVIVLAVRQPASVSASTTQYSQVLVMTYQIARSDVRYAGRCRLHDSDHTGSNVVIGKGNGCRVFALAINGCLRVHLML